MKKFIVIFLALACLCVNTYAQLNVTYLNEKGSEKIITLQLAYSYIEKSSTGYMIWIKTNNRFDKISNIYLGEDVESALQTLNDMKNLIVNEIASVSVSQPGGDIVLFYRNELGVKQLWTKQDGYAGYSWITLAQLEKAIKKFESLINN